MFYLELLTRKEKNRIKFPTIYFEFSITKTAYSVLSVYNLYRMIDIQKHGVDGFNTGVSHIIRLYEHLQSIHHSN